jgi:pimeloyl-ACP methyl ester carboxylesterase
MGDDVAALALEMYRIIPNAQLAILPDTGHFVLNVDPKKSLSIVAAFYRLSIKKGTLSREYLVSLLSTF